MKLITYLMKSAGRDIALITVSALLAGGTTAVMVAIVNAAIHHQRARSLLIVGFAAATAAKIFCSLVANLRLLRLAQRAILDLCDDLCRRVTAAPFRQVEQIGASRVLAALTDDVGALASSIQILPAFAANVSIVLGCCMYLVWMSWRAAALIAVFGFVALMTYRLILARAAVSTRLAREARDTLFGHVRSLSDGLKELKLSRARRTAFLRDDISATMAIAHDQAVITANQYAIADAWTQFAFYAVIGFALFAMSGAESVASTAYVFAALYVSGPIWGIIGSLPVFVRGEEALRKLTDLRSSLATDETGGQAEVSRVPPTVRFDGVTFAYPETARSSGFTLGPLDLDLNPGELVFVIGGNGSGKSTFVKLLTGLYSPQEGTIVVDGQTISPKTQEWFREHFSVVYSDFFLFDRLHGATDEVLARAPHYLAALQLSHKVRIEGNRLSTTSLSQGQRRRLALLCAYLEDRPIYVLDEWAADQDPSFREIFYAELLPELKRRGKTVVVVTHDDRYFHLGDRIVKLEYGQIVAATAQRPAPPSVRILAAAQSI